MTPTDLDFHCGRTCALDNAKVIASSRSLDLLHPREGESSLWALFALIVHQVSKASMYVLPQLDCHLELMLDSR